MIRSSFTIKIDQFVFFPNAHYGFLFWKLSPLVRVKLKDAVTQEAPV